ncbi:MAG: hypothetical protein Q9P01_12125 [Anaerolineae bacterium]|nr:hypothetical protein [Anaerolineae bacterium]MDQ7035546.1 hypothetical protein [Anaerolineae bacterium]
MPEEERDITDDIPLSELTVGEFKALMQEILANIAPQRDSSTASPPDEPKAEVKRKSLDEFMSGLGSN